MQKEPYYILGLDPGIASCGFALIDTSNHKILEMGAHLFDAPQESKTKVSLAVGRRNARSARRNNARTKNRQKHCFSLLKSHGIVPEESAKEWLQSKKGDKPIIDLRVDGLDRVLEDREFAQVLYSLSGRRGYFPNGEGDGKDAGDDSGKVLSALAQNDRQLEESGCRTVGEFLLQKGRSRNRAGAYENCVRNSQIVDEAHKIFEAQRSLGNLKASKDFEDAYVENITWRAINSDYDDLVYGRVGACSYFKEEKRAARADLSFELCRAYEKLGHIVMVDSEGNESSLTNDQIGQYVLKLFSVKPKSVKYSTIRKDLDLSATTFFKGVERDQENKTTVVEAKAWNLLAKKLPEALLQRMLDDRDFADDILEAVTYSSSREGLDGKLADVSLDEGERQAILDLPYSSKLFKGYGTRSRKALGMLLGAFGEEGIRTLTEAERETGLLALRLDKERNQRAALLPPYEAYDPACTNPVVLRAMSRMRRIVNAVVKIYGVPHEIHIEVGRELKQSRHEKDLINKRNRQNQQNNKVWAETIAGMRGCDVGDVTGKDLMKYALREQQNQKDAYTGEPIDLERMVLEEHYCEIDHILPYSRTCEDGRDNKVLVLGSSNQNKRERTPYEWMTQDADCGAPSWEAFRASVLANNNYPRRKREHLLNTSLDSEAEGNFLARNLNDTRYMSIAIKNYLDNTLAFPEGDRKGHVLAVAGGATSALRYGWGLNFGADSTKDRADDRHHAVDACIIAACSKATVKKVAEAHSRGRDAFRQARESRLAATQPWETFAEEVIAQREIVVPTRFVDHGVTGRAFEETNYRFDGLSDDAKKLARLYGNGKHVKKGNVYFGKEGNAHIVDGMAFLRLWLDPDANNGRGKWFADPVYYADIPALRNGSYIPRAIKAHVARIGCDPVPLGALEGPPVTLFRGDVVEVNGERARFSGINISSVKLEFDAIAADGEAVAIPTFGKWDKNTRVCVIQEDCLGHCHRDWRAKSLSED
ncbi:type II CRISPR RNA-guided endonuclease Cas9 [Adlercreutzia caecimuris]|uniref:type II CRISPR RNA-guided endonuclease Cas9 n=1 Tax=Adlercreutzia caecimuris TaxID=671266 RepID=UPI002495696C|nr:type II CRISPR RNA-guided endonuclease Cas9 [Adlercreutzia caecimuris]